MRLLLGSITLADIADMAQGRRDWLGVDTVDLEATR
jgi:hypothetical protein